jgi:LPS export ABC transporter protein LptC
MGKSFKIILLIILIIVIAAYFFLSGGEKNKVSINVKSNEVVIENFEMAKVFDDSGNFYKVTADKANIDKSSNIAKLTEFRLEYRKDDTDFVAESDFGVIEQDVRVDVEGKITGSVNELDFETSEDGKFHYDFTTEIGTMSGNVVVKHGEGTILSDKAIINQKENSVEFNGNVKVEYLR